jgi:chromosome segregation ATPase
VLKFLTEFSRAAETDTGSTITSIQETQAHIQTLQEALSEAKTRVSELEFQLNNAQNTIRQLEKQNVDQAASTVAIVNDDQHSAALSQTVRGQPLHDEHNPRHPVKQKTDLAEKFTEQSQSQPVAVTRLLEDDIVRGRIHHIDRSGAQYAIRPVR